MMRRMSDDVTRTYNWPADLPADCPPSDAQGARGVYYRFVKFSPPAATDFRRPRDLRKNQDSIPDDELCTYSALSLFADINDVRTAKNLIPGFDKKRVAQGILEPRHGVTHQSPTTPPTSTMVLKSHFDWWLPTELDPLPLFEVVAGE